MQPIEAAVLRTVLYADVFNFPLTAEEIHHFLISPQSVTREQVAHALVHSALLTDVLHTENNLTVRADRPELIARRGLRENASETLWPLAVSYARWLACLPFIRMVAVTGALAVHNAASPTDDLDYLIVTTPDRVWTARAFAVLLVRLARFRHAQVCPNYVLAETALVQQRQDLFIAHEITQMVPLYGLDLYIQFRQQNNWVETHLPNAQGAFRSENEVKPGVLWHSIKRLMEWVLISDVGTWFENWEKQRKLKRFAQDLQTPDHAAQLDDQHVKGHFQDYGHPALRRYQDRLRQFGLSEQSESLRAAGD